MLDDTKLAQLIGALGEGLEAPADGPSRILEAAEAGGPVAVRRYRPQLVAAGLVVVLAVGGTFALVHRGRRSSPAVGHGVALAPATTLGPSELRKALPETLHAGAGGSGSTDAVAGASSGAVGGLAGAGPSGAALSAPSPPATAPAAPPVQIPTRVIKTGSIDLMVDAARVSSTIGQLTTISAGFGGFVQDAKTSESTTDPTGDVTLRVPSAQFEALVARVRALGKPTAITTSGQDVTAQFVDLQARISALRASRDRYLQILQRASSIGDILAVQQQIDGIQGQIEQLQGQLNVVDNQTSYSTLAVHVSTAPAPEVTAKPPATGFAKAWAHARHSFARGLEAVVAWSGGLAVFVLCLGALALLGRLGWAVVRRRLV